MWENQNPGALCWECKAMKLLWKTGRCFCKKLKIELPYDPAISFLGIHAKELKAGSEESFPTHVHSSIIHNS